MVILEKLKTTKSIEFFVTEYYKNKWEVDKLTFHDVMYRLYVTEDKSIRQGARELHVSPSTAMLWLREQGVTKEKIKC